MYMTEVLKCQSHFCYGLIEDIFSSVTFHTPEKINPKDESSWLACMIQHLFGLFSESLCSLYVGIWEPSFVYSCFCTYHKKVKMEHVLYIIDCLKIVTDRCHSLGQWWSLKTKFGVNNSEDKSVFNSCLSRSTVSIFVVC